MFKEKRIYLELFKTELVINLTDNLQESAERYNIELDNTLAFCSMPDSQTILICLNIHNNETTSGVVAHECKHATNYALKRINHTLSADNDEIQCWILEFITDKVTEFINESKSTWFN